MLFFFGANERDSLHEVHVGSLGPIPAPVVSCNNMGLWGQFKSAVGMGMEMGQNLSALECARLGCIPILSEFHLPAVFHVGTDWVMNPFIVGWMYSSSACISYVSSLLQWPASMVTGPSFLFPNCCNLAPCHLWVKWCSDYRDWLWILISFFWFCEEPNSIIKYCKVRWNNWIGESFTKKMCKNIFETVCLVEALP